MLGSPRSAAVALLLALPPLAASGVASGADAPPGAFERSFDFGGRAFDLRLDHGAGQVRTPLPYQGELSLSLPYSVGAVGSRTLVGNPQLAATYSLWRNVGVLPDLDVVAHVDVPSAPGSLPGGRTPQSGVRAIAVKHLDGPIERLQLESEFWTSGHDLAVSYRTAVGTALRLTSNTHASLDFVAIRPSPSTGLPDQRLVQLSLSRILWPSAHAQLGLATGFAPTPSVRLSLGLNRSF